MPKNPCVYILASQRNDTLYIGVTSNLMQRIEQHIQHAMPGFTAKYDVTKLVYVEQYDDMETALRREKQLKNWRRNWKIALIETDNPEWRDLSGEICWILRLDPGSSPG